MKRKLFTGSILVFKSFICNWFTLLTPYVHLSERATEIQRFLYRIIQKCSFCVGVLLFCFIFWRYFRLSGIEFSFSSYITVQDCQGLYEPHQFILSFNYVLMAPVNLSLCCNKLREDKVSRLLTEGMQLWVCAHQRKEKQV